MKSIALRLLVVRSELSKVSLVLAISVILPFLVHFIPCQSGIPIGARLLAMFFAPFLAVILFPPHVSILCAIFSPVLNYYLTGMPLRGKVFSLSVELFVFTMISILIIKKKKDFLGTAVLAYLFTLLICTFVLKFKSAYNPLIYSLPGLGLLFMLNIFLVKSIKR